MSKKPTFKNFKKEALKNAKIKKEYEALRSEFKEKMEKLFHILMLIDKRKE